MSAQPVHYEYPDHEPRRDAQVTPRITGEPREIAEQIEQASGLRVEIIRGTLMMSPTPRRRHNLTIRCLRKLLAPHIDPDRDLFEVTSIPLPADPDDYATPDGVVCPVEAMDSDDWLLPGEDVDLAVEVTSPSERAVGTADKIVWYAEARVPVLLYLHPATGDWALYSRPSEDGYRTVTQGKYGDPAPLPEHLGGDLPTEHLPRYTR
ncbi:Uma2 family endonuclease [Streptomyces sp. CA-181903]|uniref:Uma2 family endonuclease n=1 Tax=Streptomyces sp. CA-181903 TaxID=3240055 RepID=UPI003D8D9BC8